MTKNTHPSRRTEGKRHQTSALRHRGRDHANGIEPVYRTPQGAEHRTFELTVDYVYEMWLLVTFTGHAGERLWVSSYLPFQPIEMKLTYRPDTLELPEVRWLVERIFQFELGSRTLRSAAGELASNATRSPRPEALMKLATQLHKYLDAYDIVALVKDIDDVSARVRMDVATKAIPPVAHTAAFEEHVVACFLCVRLTYIDDSFER